LQFYDRKLDSYSFESASTSILSCSVAFHLYSSNETKYKFSPCFKLRIYEILLWEMVWRAQPALQRRMAVELKWKYSMCLSSKLMSLPKFLPTTHYHVGKNVSSNSFLSSLARSTSWNLWFFWAFCCTKSIARRRISISKNESNLISAFLFEKVTYPRPGYIFRCEFVCLPLQLLIQIYY
jgi:hypothetical protein